MTATQSRRRFDVATTTLAFESEGTRCRGRLYRPDRPSTPPVVVCGPDIAAERTFGYPAYAERLARAGYAAFVFDYRGFGESDDADPSGRFGGDTHHLVDPAAQVADWHAAIDRVRRLDGERRPVALWGYGLGGGHAIRVAANRRVDAVVAIAPFLDGRAFARARSPGYLARAVAAGVRDRLASGVGRSHTVPVVGGRDEFGVLPRPTGDAYLDHVPRESDWLNETPARSLTSLVRYRPLVDAGDVASPTLLVAADTDDISPADTVAEAAERIDRSTFLRLPVDHVDPLGRAFEATVAHQLVFLDDVLG
ncbi:alpha/beta hydrolase [Haloplanus sp. C73]|uniref:alpha/beta hydrolase n=1 Tax=Haloplanus sp. C73 TaxID=3421641 RepID=UPI003EBA09F9